MKYSRAGSLLVGVSLISWSLLKISSGCPSYTKLPCTKMRVLSNNSRIFAEGEWIVEIIVIPLYFRFCTIRITFNALVLSNPVVGSSKNKRFGLWINSIPMFTLFFSPPEIPLVNSSPIFVSAQLSKPRREIKSSTLS